MKNRIKCSINGYKEYVKFKFPKGEKKIEIFNKWLQATGDVCKVIRPNDGICGRHFKPEDLTHLECEGEYLFQFLVFICIYSYSFILICISRKCSNELS